MARALWKGALSFGLVNIPVALHPAEDRRSFQFSMLDKRDLSPVGYRRYSKKSGKEVRWDDVVKGYEYDKDRYVVLSDEDFRRANVKATQTIDIKTFVPLAEIPAEHYEAPYFLAPMRNGQKVYALLRETLRATGRAAVAQVVIRTTQHLAAVLAHERALMLITLRYADELRTASGLDLPAGGLKGAGVSAKEVELARRLVDDMSEHWNPREFKDTYHDDLMKRIKEKVRSGQTREITAPGAADDAVPRSAQVIDLAELLKRSLEKPGSSGRPSARNVAGPAKPARKVAATKRRSANATTQRKRA